MQHNRRLGCFTGTGAFAGLVAIAIISAFIYFTGGAIFSPGGLNDQNQGGQPIGGVMSHAQIQQCKTCHAEFWSADTMSDRCQVCHTDITAQLRSPDQLHGAMAQASQKYECRDCHPDHRGASASLTELNLASFPHDALGFSLVKHQSKADGSALACSDCHTSDHAAFASDSCLECHRSTDMVFSDGHILSYGADCLACHDGVDRYGADFDHNKFPFPLTGKHATSTCESCHLNPHSAADLQNVSRECVSCHLEDDIHQGAYGAKCDTCHSSEAWKPAAFDHNLSAFKLDGKHSEVACADCHQNGVYQGTPAECASCHAEPVVHSGLFGADCASCHTTTAWLPAQFNLQHIFPLDHGDGGQVSCATCHPSTYTTYTCYGCHEHTESEIRSKHLEEGIPDFQNCAECHANGRKNDGDDDGDH